MQGEDPDPSFESVSDAVPLDTIPLHSTNLLTVLDPEGIIHYESPSIERIYGFEQAELVGDQVAEYFHPEDRDRVVTAFETIVRSESYTVEAVEYRHRTADGSYLWVESIAAADPTPEGFYVVNTRDISDRKAKEAELEKRTRELEGFKEAVEAAGHAVFVTDVEGTIQYTNPAFEEITGYSPEEAVGRNPRFLKSGEMSQAYYERLWETILAGEIWSEPIVNRRKSGEFYHASQSIAPLKDDDEVVGFVAIQTDSTAEVERKAELERQHERLDRFTDILSHDIKNPLSVARTRTDLARASGEEEHFDALDRAHERIETMVEELLTLTSAQTTIDDTEAVSLEREARRAWATTETEKAELAIELEWGAEVEADSGLLQHIFENLFRNAVTHNGPPLSVAVGTLSNSDDDPVGFYVEDDGAGIPPAEHERVFEHGYSTNENGHGYGLAIVREFVEAHGWEIRVAEAGTEGARFEITHVDFTS